MLRRYPAGSYAFKLWEWLRSCQTCLYGAWLMENLVCRCLTCRKRKTRCDGRKPLCSTCSENGHECMGYTDPAEGLTKRDVKAEDITERGNNDAQEIQISQSDRRAIQSLLEGRKERPRAHSTGSPELITADLKPPNFEANRRLLDTRDIGQPKSGNISFVEYKDGSAFSEGITSAGK